jgi:hypothetical protein
VVLYDRTSGDDASGGVLQFGDGSTIEVTAKTVAFTMRTFDRLRFQVQGGSRPDVARP